jgi:hypothetical protein
MLTLLLAGGAFVAGCSGESNDDEDNDDSGGTGAGQARCTAYCQRTDACPEGPDPTCVQNCVDSEADADALGCLAELQRCRTIVGAGTSADAQIAVYEAHGKTESRDRALDAVTDWIAYQTLQ